MLESLELFVLPPDRVIELPYERWALVDGRFVRVGGRVVRGVEYLPKSTVAASQIAR